jgi:hypothetical protein
MNKNNSCALLFLANGMKRYDYPAAASEPGQWTSFVHGRIIACFPERFIDTLEI